MKERTAYEECVACPYVPNDWTPCPAHIKVSDIEETIKSICALLGVEDPLKGVEDTLKKLACLKEAVNTFPLGLITGGLDADGKIGWHFVNLVIGRHSPRYDSPVQAILAGHEFYKQNPGFVLEVNHVSAGIPGPVKPGECDG